MTITKYKNPIFFYSISTVFPWAFWFIAGYVSHITLLIVINTWRLPASRDLSDWYV